MILSDAEILQAIAKKEIIISPFRRECLGSNSYDVHLGKVLLVYEDKVLDARKSHATTEIIIPEEGYVLEKDRLYLGVTEEYTETHKYVPFLEGKSSLGRLGLYIHATAGKGDVGFCNYWTLELSVVQPVRIYAGMPIGQLIYFELKGEVLVPYNQKNTAKYLQNIPKPLPSKMWQNFSSELIKKLP